MIHLKYPDLFKFRHDSKMRHHLANTFLSITFLASIPWMIMIVPVGLILGGLRAIFGAKPAGRPEKMAKSMPDDDSGISAESADSENSEAATTTTSPNSSENSEDEKEDPPQIFDFKLVTVKQKHLEFSENLGVLISEYVARLQKTPVLVTLRDVATLTNVASSAENTARIPYKKRKMKVMLIPMESISEILEHSKESDGSPVMIYLLEEMESIDILAENRKFVNEIKEIMSENGEMETLDKSTSEFLMIKKDALVWVNSGF